MTKPKYSIDSEKLISDVKEDIDLFGCSFEVLAIYALRVEDGHELEYISDYVDAERPVREETESEDEFQKLLNDWQSNIDSLKETKNRKMTLKELLEMLKKQNDPMRGIDYE